MGSIKNSNEFFGFIILLYTSNHNRMNKFIACCFIFFSPFWVEHALAQDSTFITDRYKWELGVGLNSRNDNANPFSILLKKHVSPKTSWRYGLGLNYNNKYKRNLEIAEDYSSLRVNIIYKIDKRDKQMGMAISAGIQHNYFVKLWNIYYSLDLISMYQLNKVDLPKGIDYINIDIPDSSHFTLAKFFTSKEYSFALRPSIGLQYPISKRLTISVEINSIYKCTLEKNQEYYFSIESDSVGNISYGHTQESIRKNWSYNIHFNFIPLVLINYYFD